MRVLVTGASRGIGGAIVRVIATQWPSAQIALCERASMASLDETASEVESLGVTALPLIGDLADVETPQRLVAATVEAFGGLDAVVSNAGVTGPAPLAEMTVESWDRLMNINTRAAWLLAKSAFPALKRSRGAFVAIASTAGLAPYPLMGCYPASKAALIMICRQLAQEWAADGIRVNSISPGMVRTPLSEVVYRDAELKAQREALVPVGRIADPSDIANVAGFLLSPKADYVTGENIRVDGGFLDSLKGHIPGVSIAPD